MPRGGERPSQRDRQKQRTRRQLLDAARTRFAEVGYAAVTVDDITSAVGCSRATFYLHFSGKLDVLQCIGAETTAPRAVELYAELDDVLVGGAREDFAQWMRRAIDWFDRNREILPAWDEALTLEPSFRQAAKGAIDALPEAMPRYLARWPQDRRPEARLRIELMVTQLERFFTRWAVQGTIEVSRAAAADVLTDIWYPALSATADGSCRPTDSA
ncbi:TetR/AcrR family transcriptional regulator [Speluncibacter jeojiensis]|uniref:TetR/AcrR family transcriptional regulator n=1 Tax=Speluncibacter jeojiensis TaxID=2710754 RepID=A0A9X4LYL6_9ACTN|nr:TetR/AcrR family transcriptional regulator [Rhodococcus sp. D2-41]MDG3014694.1 TetR/AcrR family transcriptional regulator [Corynebacteriales bacterium D3-21]